MLKRALITMLFLLVTQPTVIFASETKELTLHVKFDSTPNAYGQALHINKIIKINPNLKINNIVMTQTKIVSGFPVTTAVLVKPVEFNKDNNVSLQFNLLNYGFHHGGSVYTQPRLILRNGQEGKMQNESFKLKASADWNTAV